MRRLTVAAMMAVAIGLSVSSCGEESAENAGEPAASVVSADLSGISIEVHQAPG